MDDFYNLHIYNFNTTYAYHYLNRFYAEPASS